MTATLVSDFSVTLNQRRWACVLDPTLALSEYGLPLVKQLGELMELWIVREFWHILDNTQIYLRQPELILGQSTGLSAQQQRSLSQQMIRTLQEWDRLRTTTDRGSWNINFLADVLGESCVPTGTDASLIWRWESLAQSLDHCLEEHLTAIDALTTDTLTLAFRDLAALAAARPACILTHRPATEIAQNSPPAICKTLEQWNIPCQEVALTNAIADIEREQFRNLLVHAGLSKFLWAGLNLAVLHLVVPAAAMLSTAYDQNWSDEYSFPELDESIGDRATPANLWQGAQGFWYSIG